MVNVVVIQGRSPMPDLRRDALTDRSEPPIFNAPLVAVLLVASMPALYFLQTMLPDGGLSLAFRSSSLVDGSWWPGVVTSMFVHTGWGHVGMNALAALAFAPAVARLFSGVRGGLVFLLLYIMCGIISAAGYGLLHLNSDVPVLGASGAVFGLMGAALRLLGRRGRGPGPLTGRRFLTMSAALMAVNAAVGLIGFAPGMGGTQIAWEAHAIGYVAGALLIGPWFALFSKRTVTFDSRPDVSDPPV